MKEAYNKESTFVKLAIGFSGKMTQIHATPC